MKGFFVKKNSSPPGVGTSKLRTLFYEIIAKSEITTGDFTFLLAQEKKEKSETIENLLKGVMNKEDKPGLAAIEQINGYYSLLKEGMKTLGKEKIAPINNEYYIQLCVFLLKEEITTAKLKTDKDKGDLGMKIVNFLYINNDEKNHVGLKIAEILLNDKELLEKYPLVLGNIRPHTITSKEDAKEEVIKSALRAVEVSNFTSLPAISKNKDAEFLKKAAAAFKASVSLPSEAELNGIKSNHELLSVIFDVAREKGSLSTCTDIVKIYPNILIKKKELLTNLLKQGSRDSVDEVFNLLSAVEKSDDLFNIINNLDASFGIVLSQGVQNWFKGYQKERKDAFKEKPDTIDRISILLKNSFYKAIFKLQEGAKIAAEYVVEKVTDQSMAYDELGAYKAKKIPQVEAEQTICEFVDKLSVKQIYALLVKEKTARMALTDKDIIYGLGRKAFIDVLRSEHDEKVLAAKSKLPEAKEINKWFDDIEHVINGSMMEKDNIVKLNCPEYFHNLTLAEKHVIATFATKHGLIKDYILREDDMPRVIKYCQALCQIRLDKPNISEFIVEEDQWLITLALANTLDESSIMNAKYKGLPKYEELKGLIGEFDMKKFEKAFQPSESRLNDDLIKRVVLKGFAALPITEKISYIRKSINLPHEIIEYLHDDLNNEKYSLRQKVDLIKACERKIELDQEKLSSVFSSQSTSTRDLVVLINAGINNEALIISINGYFAGCTFQEQKNLLKGLLKYEHGREFIKEHLSLAGLKLAEGSIFSILNKYDKETYKLADLSIAPTAYKAQLEKCKDAWDKLLPDIEKYNKERKPAVDEKSPDYQEDIADDERAAVDGGAFQARLMNEKISQGLSIINQSTNVTDQIYNIGSLLIFLQQYLTRVFRELFNSADKVVTMADYHKVGEEMQILGDLVKCITPNLAQEAGQGR